MNLIFHTWKEPTLSLMPSSPRSCSSLRAQADSAPWRAPAVIVRMRAGRGRFHGGGGQQGGAAMSPPEVEPLVCRKYEIKRRLGKGVSA